MNLEDHCSLVTEAIADPCAVQELAQSLFGRITTLYARRGDSAHRIIGYDNLQSGSFLKGEQHRFECTGGNIKRDLLLRCDSVVVGSYFAEDNVVAVPGAIGDEHAHRSDRNYPIFRATTL